MSEKLFSKLLPNGEELIRDWLFWSKSNQSFYCAPCRLLSKTKKSKLTQIHGWALQNRLYKKLSEKVCNHEDSSQHRNSYIQWKKLM